MNLPENKCTGCGACFNACSKQAISMKENEEGYLYPFIDESRCVNCGICNKVCPAINPPAFHAEATNVYAAWNKDTEIRLDSSSGGIFDPLARSILANGGIVYGASWNENVSDLMHIRVSDVSELGRLRKSKYQQSNTGKAFSNIKEDLRSGKIVLFSGTPCQVAGLNNYLANVDKANLYTVEVLCHGVPSKKVIDNYLKMMEEKHHKKIVRIHFRFKDDNHPWRVSCCCCCCSDGTVIFDESTLDSVFWTGFLGNVCLRKSCAICDYAKKERGADITLGDYWGIWEDNSFHYDHSKGVSLVIPNSKKGDDLLEASKSTIEMIVADKELAYRHNLTLSKPFTASSKRDYFFANLGKVRYDKLIKRCFRRRFFTLRLKGVLGDRLSNKVSSFIHRRGLNE